MNQKLCNCITTNIDQLEDLESQLRVANYSLEEKEQQLEDEIMKNLELEEQMTNLQDDLDAKTEESNQLMKALIKFQEEFTKFEEKFSTVADEMTTKDKIIAELTEKLNTIERRKISTTSEPLPQTSDPRLTFDITETTILPKAQQTLAWDDFCEQFSDESSISGDKTPESEKSSKVFTFDGSTYEIQGEKNMETSTFTIFDASSSKFNELSLKFPTQSSTVARTLKKSPKILKKLIQQPLKVFESLFVQCKFCNKILPSKKSLQCHIEIHEQKCKICQKSFAKKFSLKYHMKSHKIVK